MSTQISKLPAWRNVADAITVNKRWTWGDLIPHDELEILLNMPRPKGSDTADAYHMWQLRRLQEFSSLREHLLKEHNMYLVAETGLGYRIVLPSEQTQSVQVRARSALAKALRDARDGLTYVDTSQLTAEQRKENVDAQTALASRAAVLQRLNRSPRQLSSAE